MKQTVLQPVYTLAYFQASCGNNLAALSVEKHNAVRVDVQSHLGADSDGQISEDNSRKQVISDSYLNCGLHTCRHCSVDFPFKLSVFIDDQALRSYTKNKVSIGDDGIFA